MPFGPSRPTFRIPQQPLNYALAKQIYYTKAYWHRNHSGANITDRSPGRSDYWIFNDVRTNPLTGERQQCYYLRMYRTDIHTWWEDGTYQSRYYDTSITRDVLSAFGPVRVWRDNRSPFICKVRFGLREKHFPYEDGITVDPAGYVHNLIDNQWVMRDDAKKKRAAIREQFRNNATPRILLGEFDIDKFAIYKTNTYKKFGRWETGYMAMIPPVNSGVASALFNNDEHDAIQKKIDEWHPACWSNGPCRPTKEAAATTAIEEMVCSLLNKLGDWHEKEPLSYGKVNVKELR